ncbi:MAG TPA: YceI family protein [Bryobacteraceae bacterium]|nr:YceI family protein [Bryobacteraceae bacterium]
MKRGAVLLLIVSLRLAAAENSIELDPGRTTVSFTLGDVLHTVHGTFKLKRGAVKFDSATGAASGEIVVDVASGNSGGGARDKRMHKEILESARYPEAVFTPDHVSGELAPHGESQLDLHGNFQIHGASHELTLHFRAEVKNGEVAASTGFVIPYVQWGMKNPSNFLLKVSDKVDLTIQTAGRVR